MEKSRPINTTHLLVLINNSFFLTTLKKMERLSAGSTPAVVIMDRVRAPDDAQAAAARKEHCGKGRARAPFAAMGLAR